MIVSLSTINFYLVEEEGVEPPIPARSMAAFKAVERTNAQFFHRIMVEAIRFERMEPVKVRGFSKSVV